MSEQDKFDDLEDKIRRAKAANDPDAPTKQAKDQGMDQNARQGIQAGVEMVVTIGACTAAGYGLDNWLGTKPAFLLVLFFLGVCTAFYNVYRLTSK